MVVLLLYRKGAEELTTTCGMEVTLLELGMQRGQSTPRISLLTVRLDYLWCFSSMRFYIDCYILVVFLSKDYHGQCVSEDVFRRVTSSEVLRPQSRKTQCDAGYGVGCGRFLIP